MNWPSSLFWSPPWLYAYSVKKQESLDKMSARVHIDETHPSVSQLNVCDITLCANNAPKVPISEANI